MEQVHIQIKTKIDDSTGEIQQWTHQYTGMIYHKNEKDIYLRYEENEEQSLGKTNTILKWEKNQSPAILKLVRQGETKANQVYQVGRPHRHLYQTPFGTYEMVIQPIKVNVHVEHENQGSIELDYDLFIGDQKAGHYQLWIEYHP
ncbi:DUF1934 domain-containing protein [Tepidibacillus marianensis]|uniref:DUF1934 domain-containing protein n=1 Tax=Tepidibacillus marianensis TaxID=3131995 RepID=UPI0030D4CA69